MSGGKAGGRARGHRTRTGRKTARARRPEIRKRQRGFPERSSQPISQGGRQGVVQASRMNQIPPTPQWIARARPGDRLKPTTQPSEPVSSQFEPAGLHPTCPMDLEGAVLCVCVGGVTVQTRDRHLPHLEGGSENAAPRVVHQCHLALGAQSGGVWMRHGGNGPLPPLCWLRSSRDGGTFGGIRPGTDRQLTLLDH